MSAPAQFSFDMSREDTTVRDDYFTKFEIKYKIIEGILKSLIFTRLDKIEIVFDSVLSTITGHNSFFEGKEVDYITKDLLSGVDLFGKRVQSSHSVFRKRVSLLAVKLQLEFDRKEK